MPGLSLEHHPLNSVGESDEDSGDDDEAYSITEEPVDEWEAQEEWGFYAGPARFFIQLHRRDFLPPVPSTVIPGSYDVFSNEVFRLRPNETRTVTLKFGVVVPNGYTAVFSPREWMTHNGVVLTETTLGRGKWNYLFYARVLLLKKHPNIFPGVHNDVALRLTNVSRVSRIIRRTLAISHMFTRRLDGCFVEFERCYE